jgi:hypothetical protein
MSEFATSIIDDSSFGDAATFRSSGAKKVDVTAAASAIPDPKALQEQTSKIVEERRARFNAAYDLAIAEITTGASEKIKADVDVGHYRSILYTFHFSDVKDAEFDKNGTKIRFGDGVFLRDMITKGHFHFFKKLTDHFNSSVESKGYHTGFFRHKDNGSYNIYVSWAPKPTHHTGPRKGPFKPTVSKDGGDAAATTGDNDGFVPHRPPFKHHQGPPGGGRGRGRGRGPHGPGRGGGRGFNSPGRGATPGPKGPYAVAAMKPKPATQPSA